MSRRNSMSQREDTMFQRAALHEGRVGVPGCAPSGAVDSFLEHQRASGTWKTCWSRTQSCEPRRGAQPGTLLSSRFRRERGEGMTPHQFPTALAAAGLGLLPTWRQDGMNPPFSDAGITKVLSLEVPCSMDQRAQDLPQRKREAGEGRGNVLLLSARPPGGVTAPRS